ncbi:Gfo/Idh/MocA family oxidoreductase [Micromonospora sp. WMMA1363]|uniref:Gfo/Idh/MocA family oxidoreductase n=1 Tax=Micromonospora sp. WMMA1363 TaxID=3053985 RepID=UPI00259CAAB3|nr:Gfo/Idh/MocA family oxidoreductase [Micromonospora sp. WMMA1363]MDM4721894.1 Gfo/Idh/MocA family oxidoreductase [Micromonospora sp. WMMA1363]
MRVALVGAGRMGGIHAATLSRHPDVDSLVVADIDNRRARAVADRLGATAAPSVDEVFNSGADAVVIASTTTAHPGLIRQSVRAGLPAFCEKPIGLDLPESMDTVHDVRAADAVLQIGFMRRFDAGYLTGRGLVRSGRLGRLHTIRTVGADPAPPPASYLRISGGIYRDALIHDFDMVRWITGREVAEVYASGSDAGPSMFGDVEDFDTAVVVLVLDDGTLVAATATRCNGAGYDIRTELCGESDTIAVGLDGHTPVTSVEPQRPRPPDQPRRSFQERFASAFEAEIDAFLQVARGELDNPCDGRDAVEALRVAEACQLSQQERRPVRMGEIPGF